MDIYYSHCNLLNLTPEMIFRMADIQSKRQITSEGFRKFLITIKLRIPDEIVDRIVNIFDEQQFGYIKLHHYQQTLQAFSIKAEAHEVNYVEECMHQYALLA